MKKIITYLTMASMSIIGFAQTTISHSWAGMIKNGQHLGIKEMATDDDGNIYTLMTIKGNADFDLTTAGSNTTNYNNVYGAALVKYDKDGEFVWKNTFNGSDNRGHNVVLSSGGDVIVSGIYKSSLAVNGVTKFTGNTTWSGYIVKFESDGSYISGANFATAGDTYIHGLEVDGQDNIYISGYTSAAIDLDPKSTSLLVTPTQGQTSSFVAKYDMNFNVEWGVSGTGFINMYNRAITHDANNVYVGGYIEKAYGFYEAGITRIGGVDTLKTSPMYNTSSYITVIDKVTGEPKQIEPIQSIGVYIGNRVRLFDLEYSSFDNSLVTVSDYSGNLVVEGDTLLGNTYDDNRAGFVQKYKVHTLGDLLRFDWSQSLINNGTVNSPMAIRDIDVDQSNGKVVTSGESNGGLFATKYEGNVITDSTVIYSNSWTTMDEGFAIVFDSEGEVVRVLPFTSDAIGYTQAVTINNNQLTAGGWYRGYVGLDVMGTANFDGGSTNSIGLTQYIFTDPITKVDKVELENEVAIYPNPASDMVVIQSDDILSVNVVNVEGTSVLETTESELNISSLNSGIYIFHIKTSTRTFVHKVVKE